MNGLARALDEWFNGALRGKEAEANQLRAEITSSRGPLVSMRTDPMLISPRRNGGQLIAFDQNFADMPQQRSLLRGRTLVGRPALAARRAAERDVVARP
jgi:hypothetical protein